VSGAAGEPLGSQGCWLWRRRGRCLAAPLVFPAPCCRLKLTKLRRRWRGAARRLPGGVQEPGRASHPNSDARSPPPHPHSTPLPFTRLCSFRSVLATGRRRVRDAARAGAQRRELRLQSWRRWWVAWPFCCHHGWPRLPVAAQRYSSAHTGRSSDIGLRRCRLGAERGRPRSPPRHHAPDRAPVPPARSLRSPLCSNPSSLSSWRSCGSMWKAWGGGWTARGDAAQASATMAHEQALSTREPPV
jgi:hypothetical protein